MAWRRLADADLAGADLVQDVHDTPAVLNVPDVPNVPEANMPDPNMADADA
jgi:hypothetical protein